jgi:hypothetical protein
VAMLHDAGLGVRETWFDDEAAYALALCSRD